MLYIIKSLLSVEFDRRLFAVVIIPHLFRFNYLFHFNLNIIHSFEEQLLGCLKGFALGDDMSDTVRSHVELVNLVPRLIIKLYIADVVVRSVEVLDGLDT